MGWHLVYDWWLCPEDQQERPCNRGPLPVCGLVGLVSRKYRHLKQESLSVVSWLVKRVSQVENRRMRMLVEGLSTALESHFGQIYHCPASEKSFGSTSPSVPCVQIEYRHRDSTRTKLAYTAKSCRGEDDPKGSVQNRGRDTRREVRLHRVATQYQRLLIRQTRFYPVPD